MASFTDALRASSMGRYSRIKERGARQTGRPQTLNEEIAPYEAMAATAPERITARKTEDIQERGMQLDEAAPGIQQSQFAESMEQQRANEKAQMERFYAQQAQAKKQWQDQLNAAEEARESDKWLNTLSAGYVGVSAAEKALDVGGKLFGGKGGGIWSSIMGLFSKSPKIPYIPIS